MPEPATTTVDAFDPRVDPRGVRFVTTSGTAWLLTPPADGGPRFLVRTRFSEAPDPDMAAFDDRRVRHIDGKQIEVVGVRCGPGEIPLRLGERLVADIVKPNGVPDLLATSPLRTIDVIGERVDAGSPDA